MIKRRGKGRLCWNLGDKKRGGCEALGGREDISMESMSRIREVISKKDGMKNKVMRKKGFGKEGGGLGGYTEARGQMRETQERKGVLFLNPHDLKSIVCEAIYFGVVSRNLTSHGKQLNNL